MEAAPSTAPSASGPFGHLGQVLDLPVLVPVEHGVVAALAAVVARVRARQAGGSADAVGLEVAAGVLELALVARSFYPWSDPYEAKLRQRQLEHVRSDIEALGLERPRVLGLAGHPGLYRESDRVQLSVPDLYYWMWQNGFLDINEMIEHIAGHEFEVIIVPRQWINSKRRVKMVLWGQPTILMDEPGRLVDAVLESYRVGTSRAATLYFVPKNATTKTSD